MRLSKPIRNSIQLTIDKTLKHLNHAEIMPGTRFICNREPSAFCQMPVASGGARCVHQDGLKPSSRTSNRGWKKSDVPSFSLLRSGIQTMISCTKSNGCTHPSRSLGGDVVSTKQFGAGFGSFRLRFQSKRVDGTRIYTVLWTPNTYPIALSKLLGNRLLATRKLSTLEQSTTLQRLLNTSLDTPPDLHFLKTWIRTRPWSSSCPYKGDGSAGPGARQRRLS